MGIQNEKRIKLKRSMACGNKNLITDVPGVTVGHRTIRRADAGIFTGVTAILPRKDNLFRHKLPAAAHVINGFGKSVGLTQVNELGTLETPILLSNTFAVGTCMNALINYMLARNPEIGLTTGTVNPLVLECNDGYLNTIRSMPISEQDAFAALAAASGDFAEGAVGAGTGMNCYSLKGGIGSASRIMDLGGGHYTLGALLLTNFGAFHDLTICGERIGEHTLSLPAEPDKGSVIIVLATDAPLSYRQLLRISRRAQNGLARTGGITGNGSGEIVLAFSTANPVPHFADTPLLQGSFLHEDYMDIPFRAVCECVEESVLSSLLHAEPLVGREKHTRKSLRQILGWSL